MSSLETASLPDSESIQRFNDFVDNCLRGNKPFVLQIEGEQEIAAAELPLPDTTRVDTNNFLYNFPTEDVYVGERLRQHIVTAERRINAQGAIRRLRVAQSAVEGSYPSYLETSTDEPGITFMYENSSFPKQSQSIDTRFLDTLLDRVTAGIQFKQAGY